MKDKVVCPICQGEFRQITATHLKTHNLTMAEFRKKYPKAKIECEEKSQQRLDTLDRRMKEEPDFAEEWVESKVRAGKESAKVRARRCVEDPEFAERERERCRKAGEGGNKTRKKQAQLRAKEREEVRRQNLSNMGPGGILDGLIVCPICGVLRKSLVRHVELHNLTPKEFSKLYPDVVIKTSEALAVWKNSMREHWDDPVYRKGMSERQIARWEDPEYRRRMGEAISKAQNQPEVYVKMCENMRKARAKSVFCNSRPEQAIKAVLDEFEIDYKAQATLPEADKYLPRAGHPYDFLLPDHKIAIEVDGCYWHCCRECYPDDSIFEKDERVDPVKSRERDRQITAAVDRTDWTLLRFWEHEIAEDPKGTLSRIGFALLSGCA